MYYSNTSVRGEASRGNYEPVHIPSDAYWNCCVTSGYYFVDQKSTTNKKLKLLC